MKEVDPPKFQWGTTFEPNSGHNKNEWGRCEKNETESEIKFIVAYTVKGDLAKIGTRGFLSSRLTEQ